MKRGGRGLVNVNQKTMLGIVRSFENEFIHHNISEVNCIVAHNCFLVNIKDVGHLLDETNNFFRCRIAPNNTTIYALFVLL